MTSWRALIPKRHWTPAYLASRARLAMWQRAHPEAPWLVAGAIDFVDQWLTREDIVVEFGSGRSTRWFAARAGRVFSLEHDRAWFERVGAELERDGVDNVELIHTEDSERYLEPIADRRLEPTLVLVDGRRRDAAALWAIEALPAGGLLIIDNAERYLPSDSESPESIGPRAEPISAGWRRVAELIEPGRRIWYHNGVFSTLTVTL